MSPPKPGTVQVGEALQCEEASSTRCSRRPQVPVAGRQRQFDCADSALPRLPNQVLSSSASANRRTPRPSCNWTTSRACSRTPCSPTPICSDVGHYVEGLGLAGTGSSTTAAVEWRSPCVAWPLWRRRRTLKDGAKGKFAERRLRQGHLATRPRAFYGSQGPSCDKAEGLFHSVISVWEVSSCPCLGRGGRTRGTASPPPFCPSRFGDEVAM